MENLLIYLIKSSTLLLFFFTTYYFLLKKETFFTANRWFLIAGIFCSAFLPLISFQKIVWVEPAVSTLQLVNSATTSTSVTNAVNLEENTFSWELLLIILYSLGVLIFLSKLIIEFYSLKKIIKTNNKKHADGCEFIEVNQLISPFSFFNKIVYNPTLFQAEELENIIEHEKIHAKQWHSLDVLMARMHCIIFWWNPLVWFYKKAMIQNLEFIADQNALAKVVDKKSYLLTLLKITTAENPVAITNHFYQSLIKKRIVMLHTNQSKKYNSWKYFVVLPALVFFMLTYQVEVIAQEKQPKTGSAHQKLSLIEQEITAQTTNQELEEASMLFNQEFATTLEYSKLKRNKKGEIIAIKVALKQNSSKSDIKTVYEVLGNTPIKSFKVFVGVDPNGKVEFGYGETKAYMLVGKNIKNQKIVDSIYNVEKNTTSVKIVNTTNQMSFKTSSPAENIEVKEVQKSIDDDGLLIIVDGNVVTKDELKKIEPRTIKSVNVLKNANTKDVEYTELVSKYGEKAKNGVIKIETLELEKTNSKEEKWKVSTEAFKLNKENGGFIVHKRSQDKNFEFIKNELEKIGVFAKFSGIKRNKEGLITSIKIKLIDKERNHKIAENWTTLQNPNGIAEISIGRTNGKLFLSAQ